MAKPKGNVFPKLSTLNLTKNSFNEANTTDTNSLLVEGNIGIGTTSPTAKVTITGVGSSLEHGESAIYLNAGNYDGGMVGRGTGNSWSTRFTSTDAIQAAGKQISPFWHPLKRDSNESEPQQRC